MIDLKKIISKEIKNSLEKKVEFSVDISKEKNFGDYSSNVAFRLASFLKEPPSKIASNLAFKLQKSKRLARYFQKIEAQNGFLNFSLKKEFLIKELKKILKEKSAYPRFRKVSQKVILEFVSANPTGPLTMANARGGFLGDVLARVLKKRGYQVFCEYYINDAKVSAQIKELGRAALKKTKSYFTPYLKKILKKYQREIKNLIRKFKNQPQKLDSEIGFFLAKKIQKDNQEFISKKLKIKFDKFFSEETLYEKSNIEKTLKILKNKKLVYEKENALWLKTSLYGDKKDRVVIRSDGTPTYFLSDIAYHLEKEKRGFDLFVNIWGADHYGHIQRLKSALKMFRIKEEKLKVILVQMVCAPDINKQIKTSFFFF